MMKIKNEDCDSKIERIKNYQINHKLKNKEDFTFLNFNEIGTYKNKAS